MLLGEAERWKGHVVRMREKCVLNIGHNLKGQGHWSTQEVAKQDNKVEAKRMASGGI